MIDGRPSPRSEAEIQAWLVAQISRRLNIDRHEIRLDEPLIAHGVDSMQFVVIVGELEDWLGCRFRSNPLVKYPSVNALSKYLARESQSASSDRDAETA